MKKLFSLLTRTGDGILQELRFLKEELKSGFTLIPDESQELEYNGEDPYTVSILAELKK